MKKIHIKICGFNENDKFSYGHIFLKILRKHFDVEMSDNPDYVFFNESNYDHLKYKNSVKIFFTGENVTPNFNLCDYAIGFDYLIFGDRYYRFPLYLAAIFYKEKELLLAGEMNFAKQLSLTLRDLADKTEFCSFVYSNYRADAARKVFFDRLSAYKNVNAGGAYLNNTGGVTDNKLAFEMKHKFSIAFENSSRAGYTTEKLVCSLLAKTIPIYWGNPAIGKEFNTKRFVNCHDYNNFDEVVERIKVLDSDDEAYLDMVNAPVLADNYDIGQVYQGLEDFLVSIFKQPYEDCRRRTINPIKLIEMEKRELFSRWLNDRYNSLKKAAAFLYKPLKRLWFIERMKMNIYSKKK